MIIMDDHFILFYACVELKYMQYKREHYVRTNSMN